MTISVELGRSARFEFDEAFDWYAERSVQAALGFASEIDLAIEKIGTTPERFPPTYAGCRRYILNRYPYNVIYYQTDERIFIVAIAHTKRHPTYWESRLK
jgi:toxin ParE1/3/4